MGWGCGLGGIKLDLHLSQFDTITCLNLTLHLSQFDTPILPYNKESYKKRKSNVKNKKKTQGVFSFRTNTTCVCLLMLKLQLNEGMLVVAA